MTSPLDGTNERPVFAVGTGRCGSTLFSEMMRLHPRILSVSEWFTVLGERGAVEDTPADGSAYWNLLTIPSRDAAELLARYPTSAYGGNFGSSPRFLAAAVTCSRKLMPAA